MDDAWPTLGEWQLLYEAAADFKQAACWDWMEETDVFGVQCPGGMIYYCSIMGGGDAHFGIAAYRGTEGLNTFLESLDGAIGSDFFYRQDCLMCSFEDRKMLAKEDRQVIKSLALKFRGRNQWPLFRDYSPGWYPWVLTASQCSSLTHILRQGLAVSLRCREDKRFIYRKGTKLFVRALRQNAAGERDWVDCYREPPPTERTFAVFRLQDEVLTRRLKNIKPSHADAVEADLFHIPTPIQDGGRPYFPFICVLMEKASGLVLATEMVTNIKDDGHLLLSLLIDVILSSGKKPAVIYVAEEAVEQLLAAFGEQIGIAVQLTQRSTAMREFRLGAERHFGNRD